ncbi:MAG: acyl carrier protein [Lachnospiraceae bacterium]|nr:acyl carrier protein [Lachnospiraceae bacterium]
MFDRIKEIIVEQLGVDETEIEMTSDLKDDLDADSLSLFELVMALEAEYDIEIPADDLGQIATVENLIDYLKSKGIDD